MKFGCPGKSGKPWMITCQQNKIQASLWTCFVFDDHIRKCTIGEARDVLVGKYKPRIYRG